MDGPFVGCYCRYHCGLSSLTVDIIPNFIFRYIMAGKIGRYVRNLWNVPLKCKVVLKGETIERQSHKIRNPRKKIGETNPYVHPFCCILILFENYISLSFLWKKLLTKYNSSDIHRIWKDPLLSKNPEGNKIYVNDFDCYIHHVGSMKYVSDRM